MDDVLFFPSSAALKAYHDLHVTYRRCGCWFIPDFQFIDTPVLHVLFKSRLAYERWRDSGSPVQLSLF